MTNQPTTPTTSTTERERCSGCGNEIDPDICWCGESIASHLYDGHSAVPMGCDCGRIDQEDEQMTTPTHSTEAEKGRSE